MLHHKAYKSIEDKEKLRYRTSRSGWFTGD